MKAERYHADAPVSFGRRRLLECVRDAVASGDKTKLRPALDLLWASQHLDGLWQLEQHLGRHAAEATRPVPTGSGRGPAMMSVR